MEQYIIAKLKKLYPDRCVSNMYKEHPLEYSYLREVAAKNHLTISDFLESIGFKYLIRKHGDSSRKFDAQTAKWLIDEYQFTGTDFAKMFDVTRAEISRRILSNVIHTNWKSNYVRYSEAEHIRSMAQRDCFELKEDDLYIRISNNSKNICVFIMNDSTIKVVFELPERLKTTLEKRNFHMLGPQDMNIKKNLIPVKVMGETMAAYKSSDMSSTIRIRYTRLGITRDEYLKLLGYSGLCRNGKGTDQDILNILRKYADNKKQIYFPNSGPYRPAEYNTIANKASREQMSMEELFEFFGFTKVQGRQITTQLKKSEQLRVEVSQLCINSTNKVHIDSNSDLYKRLYSFCKLKNRPIDQILSDWGYERVWKKDS